MAYDKAVDSAELDTALTAIAGVLREKTGTSESLIFPEGFLTLLDSISSGGERVLPDLVTKMTGGTYVATEDTQQQVRIYHNLGTTPKLALVWSEATNTGRLGWFLHFGGTGGIGGYDHGTDLMYADLQTPFKRGATLDETRLLPCLTSAQTAVYTGDILYWLAWV